MQFQNPFPTLFLFSYVLILSSVTFLSASTIQLNDGYDSGVIVVNDPQWDEEFTFSNGLTLTSFDLNDPKAFVYDHIMGYFTNGFASQCANANMGYDWDNTVAVPSELVPCEIYEYFVDSTSVAEDSVKVPAVDRFWRHGSYSPWDFFIYTERPEKHMFFVTSTDGRNVKFQIYNEEYTKYTEGPDEEVVTLIKSYSLRWAADSAGDGKFKQNVTVVNGNQLQENAPYTFSLSQKKLSFEMNRDQSVEIGLYSLKGQVIKSRQGRRVVLSLHDLARGTYLLRIKSAGQLFSERIYIP